MSTMRLEVVMAAAPADYRPTAPAKEKRDRSGSTLDVKLEGTPDILEGTRHARRNGLVTVGFALETETGTTRAKAKRSRKDLDVIVLNRAGEAGAGFETETNRVTIITEEGEEPLELMSKRDVAERIFDEVERRL